MTADQLKKHLSHRPTKEELEARNILPEHSDRVSPAIVAHQKELERKMTEDRLKEALGKRKTVEEVVRKGVLNRKCFQTRKG